jgi:membrane-associated phospholipid phosphatase
MNSGRNRVLPLLITGLLFFSTFFILRKFPIPFINVFMLASAVSVLLNAVITYWWKISSHMIGTGGLTALAFALFYRLNGDIKGILILAVLIAGCAGFARLRLNAHNQSQVYGGFALGFITVFSILLTLRTV